MHPELVAISNLWRADSTIDRLKAEHEGLRVAQAAAAASSTTAVAAKEAARAALETLRTEERATHRELDTYITKREETRRMIDQGTAPDYFAAERQLAKCTALIDELETRALEFMERADAVAATLARHAEEVTTAAVATVAAKSALAARDASLRTEMAATLAARTEALAALPPDLRSPYEQLRQRKRPALVNVVDGTCQTCHTKVQLQRIVEVATSRANHICPGCHGWLLP